MTDHDEIFRGDPELARKLAHAAPPVPPPAGLKARVLERVRGCQVRYASAAQWTPTGLDGVEVRVLAVDEENGRQTVLVRMSPGAAYPCHRHAGHEECYVIEGDLRDGDLRMKAGDYSRFDGGTEHGPLSTERGCLLLVTSSLHDEIVD